MLQGALTEPTISHYTQLLDGGRNARYSMKGKNDVTECSKLIP